MTWSWIGVVTAGLAQVANREWPEQSSWPVLIVVAVVTATAAVCVPRFVTRELRRQEVCLVRGSGSSSAAPGL
jgi:hypothetical protein